MYELDCSDLPVDLAKVAIRAAEKTIERSNCSPNGVRVLNKTYLVILNGDGSETDQLYGELRQSMLGAVQDELREHADEYSESEIDEYWQGIKFRQV
jgi:hypothetical protein